MDDHCAPAALDLALTRSAAQEYAVDGIRVNALVAGGFDTEMLRTAFSRTVGGDPAKVQEAIKGYAARVAGRVGRPEEATEAVLWLCSDAASYVTGQSMILDGGVTASGTMKTDLPFGLDRRHEKAQARAVFVNQLQLQ
jgi:NAD(P)-dependent dehydrogenase (short-subunit alcohol dehydrogenase family)